MDKMNILHTTQSVCLFIVSIAISHKMYYDIIMERDINNHNNHKHGGLKNETYQC